jgi:hypothetical protein
MAKEREKMGSFIVFLQRLDILMSAYKTEHMIF